VSRADDVVLEQHLVETLREQQWVLLQVWGCGCGHGCVYVNGCGCECGCGCGYVRRVETLCEQQ